MKIRTELLRELNVSAFGRLRGVIDFSPPYQREGNVWRSETRSGLIDSILNGLDVPKLYFERATTRKVGSDGLAFQYAVIDGKQRLEAITQFLDGELPLPSDFWYFEDDTVDAKGLTLPELRERHPHLAQRFLDYELPVVSVTTDSFDLIEEMFQRLNASTSLNAAERRNALTGPTRDAANSLSEHELLKRRSPIKSARYKYRELGAKFIAIEQQMEDRGRILDTKADTLYQLFTASRGENPSIDAGTMETYRQRSIATLDRMFDKFEDNDRLLASIGTVVVYYIVFRDQSIASATTRDMLQVFEERRREVSRMAETDPGYAQPENARLREYSILVQSTNDGKALERRAQILSAYIGSYSDADPLAGLRTIGDGDLPDEDEEDPSS